MELERNTHMEVEKILHMKEGEGENSYANNSALQRAVMTKARPVLERSAKALYLDLQPESLLMADMGCSSGPNTLQVVSEIIDIIDEVSRSAGLQPPMFNVYLNDLPGNDFNTIFKHLPSFYKRIARDKGKNFGPCFVSGTPRSFYGRVFPDQSLHFIISSYSIHWLSQVPKGLVTENGTALNKNNIYIAETSPKEVSNVYYSQFKRDFMLFLRSRAREMVPGGRMVLTFQGSNASDHPDSIFELLGSNIHDMVLQGLVEQDKLDRFNLPFYSPTTDEVRQLIEAEGSFALDELQTFTVDWSVDTTKTLDSRAESITKCIRAVTESLLTNKFGDAAMDELFLRFERSVKERMAIERCEYLNIVVSMTKT